MLTRSHARALARREAAARAAVFIVVSPSATGKGTHTRWTYPENVNDKRSKHLDARARRHKVDHATTYVISSCSSISSGESSGEDPPVITPGSSFDAIPATPRRSKKPFTTPPRLSPKKLQRSPRGHWITGNGAMRIVFVEESAEQAKLREMQNEIKYQRIVERELEILLRERDIARGEENGDFCMDVETETSGTWRNQASTSADVSAVEAPAAVYTRGDTEPFEEIPFMAVHSGRVRPLGPNGTELIDPITFMPYSMDASRIETWRQGVV